MTLRVAAVLLAGGSGSRVGAARNKVLLSVGGLPVLTHSVRRAAALRWVTRLVLVTRPGEESEVESLTAPHAGGVDLGFAPGGATRHGSEWSALQVLAPAIDDGEYDVVVIHDSARPLASTTLWETVIETAARHGGAVPVRPQPGLINRSVADATPVSDLVGVQTPQAFRAEALLTAYRAAARDDFEGTDTAACVAAYTNLRICGVPAPATNLKVTFREDVALAEALL